MICLFALLGPLFAGGRRETPASAPLRLGTLAIHRETVRTIPVYVRLTAAEASLPSSAAKQFERQLLPASVALYLPVRFDLSAAEGSFSYERDLGFRAVARRELGDGLAEVSVEVATVDPVPKKLGRQTVAFPLAQLAGESNSAPMQPAQRAVELAARKASLRSGWALVESLSFDRGTGTFTATVVVSRE